MGATAVAGHHLGLDLGATNLKWVVVEHEADDWRSSRTARSRPAPRTARPASSSSSPRSRARSIARLAGARRLVGVGVPGLYDPAAGTTRFLVNLPGDWDGVPVAAPMSAALGSPSR